MIRACIFDLGGTIVDKYSLSPFISFKNAFHKKKILISDDLIYKDMGMEKKEHIKLILQNKKVSERWNNLYNDYPNFKDVSEIYHLFNENQEINCKNIEIFYAVKANSHKKIIGLLNRLGSSFDCASLNEIEICLDCNVPVHKISYGSTLRTQNEFVG